MESPHKNQCKFPVHQSTAHYGVGAGRHSALLYPTASEGYLGFHWDQFAGYRNYTGWAAARQQPQNWLSELVHLTCCRICVRSLSGTIHYHNKQYRPQKGGICVANHTSPIDVLILTTDGCYAMVGQVHGGLMGIIQRAMVKACPHVWFERSEMKDRHLVTKRLKEHIADKKKLPILIFPEGTCINNTSVMMFKKGALKLEEPYIQLQLSITLSLVMHFGTVVSTTW